MKLVFDMDFFVLYEMFLRMLLVVVAASVFLVWSIHPGIKLALIVFFGLWVFIPAIKAGMVSYGSRRED